MKDILKKLEEIKLRIAWAEAFAEKGNYQKLEATFISISLRAQEGLKITESLHTRDDGTPHIPEKIT